jgi:hypothetical protein
MIESYDEFLSKAMELQEKLCNLIMPVMMMKTEVMIKEENFDESEGATIVFEDAVESEIKNDKDIEEEINLQARKLPKRNKKQPVQHTEVFKCETCFKNFNVRILAKGSKALCSSLFTFRSSQNSSHISCSIRFKETSFAINAQKLSKPNHVCGCTREYIPIS